MSTPVGEQRVDFFWELVDVSTMSYFSAALERALEDLSWSQQELIVATGIHRTSMSGYVRGSTPVGAKILSRICEALPEQQRPYLVRGWLLDQVPAGLQSQVEILARTDAVREDPAPVALDCPAEVRQGLELLARRSMHPPVRDLIVDLARLLAER
jgi:transcriptional regulator with XRE-family HTH domain